MRLMTANDVAWYLGVDVHTVYRKAKTGELPCYRIGRLIRFKREEVEEATKKASTRCRSNPAVSC